MAGIIVLRDRGEDRAAHVTHMETFFDLVYVFAFTQLSEHLYEHVSVSGGLETLVMLLALWWAWSDTAWATGWIDPERTPVVLLLSILMALSLVAASAVPEAFAGRGETFAVAYVAMQLLRGVFMVTTFGPRSPMGRNYLHLLSWSAITGAIWIAGGIVDDPHLRLILWGSAALVDLSAPMHGYRLPWLGSTPDQDWTVAGGHLAERCELVLMVAFGETILRLGEAFTREHGSPLVGTAFIVGFVLIVSLVLTYFGRHAEAGATVIMAARADAAAIGRSGYTYPHTLMIAAVVAISVAIHKAIEHPHDSVTLGFALICVGAPALYLTAIAVSKRLLGHGRVGPTLLGIAAVVVFGGLAALDSRIVTLIVVSIVCVGVAAWSRLEPAPGH